MVFLLLAVEEQVEVTGTRSTKTSTPLLRPGLPPPTAPDSNYSAGLLLHSTNSTTTSTISTTSSTISTVGVYNKVQ